MGRWVGVRVLVVATTLLVTSSSNASPFAPPGKGLYLEQPLADGAAGNGHEAQGLPTMQQSLWITTNTYELAHWAIGKVLDPYDTKTFARSALGRLAIGVVDFGLLIFPPGNAWLHEEWHRSVLKARGVDSYNAVYDFSFAGVIPVSHVNDQALARFKATHPSEFVRMGTAGIESGYELATNMEKVQVFYAPRTWPAIAIGMHLLQNSFYMATCANEESNATTLELEQNEGRNIAKRDFTGLDCIGWTYDLFRPNEPYEARGLHPSGYGIRRYRRFSDLNEQEREWLENQRTLSFLNFLDPMWLGIQPFQFGSVRTTGHVRHLPTSFGHVLDLDIILHSGKWNVFGGIHSYFNRTHYFPGLAFELHRFPIPNILDRPAWVGVRAGLWLQPRDQSFTTATIEPGGLLAARLGYEVTRELSSFVELEGKTDGWVAGNVSLGESAAFRAGLTLWAR